MAKRQKVSDDEMNKDIISELPTNLIELILERLCISEAARTSILSKKWRNIWASRPNIKLDKPFFLGITPKKRENSDQFGRIIDRILVVHTGPIKRFVVYIPFAEVHMDIWMLILSRNHINEIVVFNDDGLRLCNLPCSFYSCRQLTDIQLSNCQFNPPLRFSGYSNLKQLRLTKSRISPHTGSLISSLPSLVTLILQGCTGVENLKTLPPKLINLFLHRNTVIPWQYFLAKTNITVLGISSPKAVLNANQLNLRIFFANLPQLASFFFDGFLLQLLTADISRKLYVCHKLTTIGLDIIRFNDLGQVSCVLHLLRSCPNLQRLKIICATEMKDDMKQDDLDNMEATKMDMSLKNLQIVKLNCFNGSKVEMLFVKFILLHSCMLQQLIIHTRKDMDAKEELRISRQLMKFHRASVLSEIIFDKFNETDHRSSFC